MNELKTKAHSQIGDNKTCSHTTRAVCTLFETKNQNKQSISNRIFLCS